ncbi:MAG: hypothetical protein MHM6MM_008796 [Cercozoa sp. M6MM]
MNRRWTQFCHAHRVTSAEQKELLRLCSASTPLSALSSWFKRLTPGKQHAYFGFLCQMRRSFAACFGEGYERCVCNWLLISCVCCGQLVKLGKPGNLVNYLNHMGTHLSDSAVAEVREWLGTHVADDAPDYFHDTSQVLRPHMLTHTKLAKQTAPRFFVSPDAECLFNAVCHLQHKSKLEQTESENTVETRQTKTSDEVEDAETNEPPKKKQKRRISGSMSSVASTMTAMPGKEAPDSDVNATRNQDDVSELPHIGNVDTLVQSETRGTPEYLRAMALFYAQKALMPTSFAPLPDALQRYKLVQTAKEASEKSAQLRAFWKDIGQDIALIKWTDS